MIQMIDAKFFDDDVPVVGDGLALKVCWHATVVDATGSVSVKVWDKAFRAITSVTGDRLRELWEAGVDRPGDQDHILKDLNATLDREVYLLCSARPWSYGSNPVNHTVDISIDDAEILSSPYDAPSQ